MSDNFNNVLKEIKGLKKNLSFFSPSNNKEFEISPLSLKQQKTIIENGFSSSLSILFFNVTFFNIIKENFSGDVKFLNTLDRVNISLSLRQKISDEYKDEDDVTYSIKDVINQNRSYEEIVIKPSVVKTENFTFKLRNPNLEIDNKINKILLNKYKNKNLDDSSINLLISDLYVYEMLKFIEEISFNDNTINILDNLDNSLKLISEINTYELKGILKYINKVRDLELKLSKIPKTDTNINITADFFIVQ
tara:strand:- start:402 stop:1148 length:747 start_codon:yes stop_codon:yes gene_type:complete